MPCEKGDLSPLLAAIDQDVYWWIGGREDREAGTGVYVSGFFSFEDGDGGRRVGMLFLRDRGEGEGEGGYI